MLALTGFATVILLLTFIMTKRMSPLVALIILPVIASLAIGSGVQTGEFILQGIRSLAPVVAMFVFAILYFGIVSDAGMFDPLIDGIVNAVGTHPRWIVPGSALLAMLCHFDGSGASTFLIAVPAMLPLYEKLDIDRRLLACAVAMAAGVMNILPWGGPTLRASAALETPTTALFTPMIPVLCAGLISVLVLCYLLGLREERLHGSTRALHVSENAPRTLSETEQNIRQPRKRWINVVLTLLVVTFMLAGWAPAAVAFMAGTALALMINYPGLASQRARIDAHAKAALMMASILLAAGVFTGIMKESGMLTAMAEFSVAHVSTDAAQRIPLLMGLLSMPLSLLFDPDSFYFGILPIVSEIAQSSGVSPIHVGQAALMGQMTTGFPVSPLTPATFLLVGLTGVDLGEHQRFTIPFLWGLSIVMTLTALILGIIPW